MRSWVFTCGSGSDPERSEVSPLLIVFFDLALIVSLDYAGAFTLPHLTDNTVNQLLEGPAGLVYGISALIFLVGEILC